MKKNTNNPAPSGEKRSVMKKVWLILANLVLFFAVYEACVFAGEKAGSVLPYQICTIIYGAAIVALVSVYYYMVRVNEDEKKKKNALWLLCWIFPLIAVILIDMTDLFVVEYFSGLFKALL